VHSSNINLLIFRFNQKGKQRCATGARSDDGKVHVIKLKKNEFSFLTEQSEKVL